MDAQQRIVITGRGLKAPGVRNVQEFYEILRDGECTLQVRDGLGPRGTSLAVGVVEEDFADLLGRHYERLPRISRLAVAGTAEALEDAGIDFEQRDRRRVAVIMGTSIGCAQELETSASYSTRDDFRHFPFLSAGLSNTHSLASAICAHFGFQGPAITLGTGCTGAVDAFIIAKMLLQSGQVDVCIAGGSDAPINRLCIYGFSKLNTLALDEPLERAGVPFSADHDNFVLSEGSGVLILEREFDALARRTRIYGTIDGVAVNNDALSIHQSDDTGDSMRRALSEAVAGQAPTYVSSQALGLRVNDTNDSIAIQSLFGDDVPVTSDKGHIGHTMGAAGAIQAIEALLSIEHGMIPATIRTNGIGYESLPIVIENRHQPVHSVAVTTHGYGGNNGCAVVSKFTAN